MSTVAPMSVHKHTKPLSNSSRTRRQNHACDQCRRSKRACDGVSTQRLSCSYCAKTKKRCTTEWAASRAQTLSKNTPRDSILDSLSPDNVFPWLSPDPGTSRPYDMLKDLFQLHTAPTQELMAWPPIDLDLSESLTPYNFSSPVFPFQETHHRPEKQYCGNLDVLSSAGNILDGLPQAIDDLDLPSQHTSGLELGPNDTQGSTTINEYDNISEALLCTIDDCQSPCLSPFSIQQRMVTSTNNKLTSENLLVVYHDVLEHNLSCWLSDTTCPYQLGPQTNSQISSEWGSSWSNRIYQRTIKLDRVAQSHGLVKLTKREDHAASKALHVAIMAFAAQWAQGSSRQRAEYNDKLSNESFHQQAEEFDRTLQNNLWDQARRALQEVANLDSYRVACAEIIMGLSQKPWTFDDETQTSASDQKLDAFCMDSLFLEVRDIIDKDGPPKYMESAARRMHALKYRYDALSKGQKSKASMKIDQPSSISPDDQSTIGLLYWLTIMFDTVSSSMNERPVVVVDEECPHHSQDDSHQGAIAGRWNLDLFIRGGLKETKRTYWPCSYEVAAKDVVRSAPVKVLLFRHLSYLQNALRKGIPKSQVEEIIESTLLLYEYWNRTHGAFIAEMVADHHSVPRRIQGWFVVISGHWHLAAMMLADLLEFIDENRLATEDGAISRVACRYAQTMRSRSARSLSDLARIATPDTADATLGTPQMPGFHHAVNEGTLLTEPWTIILIRAFSKASIIFLGKTNQAVALLGFGNPELEDSIRRAEECIKGLWLLGKKSDMARRIAVTLSSALSSIRPPA
ncbi:putative C6 transcription factor [Aspergillus stella-maris]|uniref:putative C6 transcription factor n=1 Tax=Aspergillus stella-maris TaxID=1810926 RepID=UPI003CCCB000